MAAIVTINHKKKFLILSGFEEMRMRDGGVMRFLDPFEY